MNTTTKQMSNFDKDAINSPRRLQDTEIYMNLTSSHHWSRQNKNPHLKVSYNTENHNSITKRVKNRNVGVSQHVSPRSDLRNKNLSNPNDIEVISRAKFNFTVEDQDSEVPAPQLCREEK